MLGERGIEVSYETILRWGARFGPPIANRLRRSRPRAHPKWHLDEMFTSFGGRRLYLWRAIDQDGEILDVLVQAKRDTKAALKLMRRLLKRQGFALRTIVTETMVTDKWRAYAAAIRERGLTARQHQAKWKNNRIESSHVPIRIRERKMQRFRSIGSTQRILSVHGAVYNTFNTRRHLITASDHRKRRKNAFRQWREAVAVAT